jgi:GNAT superfamily N-acetyltransferase
MLLASRIETAEDLESVRQIFNECLSFMTKPFDPITPEQQAKWWAELPYKVLRYKAFVYRLPDAPAIVAYSLLQWHKDGRITPLFGIRKDARGKNIAREIIQHYLAEADGPLYGEELCSHTAIIKMNEEAGWELVREENGVRYLYHPNEKATQRYPNYETILEYWSL